MTMKQVQNLLQYLGYYDGIPNGVYDDKTRDAVYDFQSAYGTIGVDGIPGPEVEKALKDAVAYGMPKYKESGDFWDDIKYFKKSEFKCKCGKCGGFPADPDEKLVRTLDTIRAHFGVPVRVNSGIRCKTHNANVGGASGSQHLYGTAADIVIRGITPKQAAAYAETLLPNTGGIGIYSWGIHVDVRKTKSRWNG